MTSFSPQLLGPQDPLPVTIANPAGASPFLLIADHAGNAIPQALGDLGIAAAELGRHIGWDIGIGAVGEILAERLDAMLIRQTFSRLVIDCNRDPDATDAIPAISDGTEIPANRELPPEARAARIAAIHSPYQAAIANACARRAAAGQPTVLVALHSFTPRMNAFDRPWQIGVLHNGYNDGFAHRLLARLRSRELVVGDNEPYRMDRIDYTVPRHAFPARLAYAEIEVRQDLIGDNDGVDRWAGILATTFGEAISGPV